MEPGAYLLVCLALEIFQVIGVGLKSRSKKVNHARFAAGLFANRSGRHQSGVPWRLRKVVRPHLDRFELRCETSDEELPGAGLEVVEGAQQRFCDDLGIVANDFSVDVFVEESRAFELIRFVHLGEGEGGHATDGEPFVLPGEDLVREIDLFVNQFHSGGDGRVLQLLGDGVQVGVEP